MTIEDLKNVYLFKHLSDETLRDLASISTIREYEPGQVLFFEGEKAENLYILLEGKLSAEARVAKLILESPEIFEILKHNQIASFLNITPETLSRVLSKLKDKKIISIEGKKIQIKDREKLRKVSKDEPLIFVK